MGGQVASVATTILVGFFAQEKRLPAASATSKASATVVEIDLSFFIPLLLLDIYWNPCPVLKQFIV
jgi:hypothetical protein